MPTCDEAALAAHGSSPTVIFNAMSKTAVHIGTSGNGASLVSMPKAPNNNAERNSGTIATQHKWPPWPFRKPSHFQPC